MSLGKNKNMVETIFDYYQKYLDEYARADVYSNL